MQDPATILSEKPCWKPFCVYFSLAVLISVRASATLTSFTAKKPEREKSSCNGQHLLLKKFA
jgi:hypothetical protein